jgi:hypothetical protein
MHYMQQFSAMDARIAKKQGNFGMVSRAADRAV